jgi:hypothetical protein
MDSSTKTLIIVIIFCILTVTIFRPFECVEEKRVIISENQAEHVYDESTMVDLEKPVSSDKTEHYHMSNRLPTNDPSSKSDMSSSSMNSEEIVHVMRMNQMEENQFEMKIPLTREKMLKMQENCRANKKTSDLDDFDQHELIMSDTMINMMHNMRSEQKMKTSQNQYIDEILCRDQNMSNENLSEVIDSYRFQTMRSIEAGNDYNRYSFTRSKFYQPVHF